MYIGILPVFAVAANKAMSWGMSAVGHRFWDISLREQALNVKINMI
jgi:hypothetical protein